MKAQSAVGGAKSSQTSIKAKSSSPAGESQKAAPKKSDKASQVEISSEAKGRAKELALENKLLKNKLKESRKNLAASNEALKVERSGGDRLIRKPGIFLIGGFSLAGLSESEGIAAMGEHIPQAEHFSWNQEGKILDLIRRRPPGEPIILVGHGLGGDSAVNIANKLNSLEYGYRKVDLLITMDSTGINNDIISQNVKENLNFIDGEGGLFSDGPNIARDSELTQVHNKLLKDEGEAMDESSGVQFQIFDKINTLLASKQREKPQNEFLEKVQQGQMVKVNAEKLDKLVARDLTGKS